ncbi:MAG: hypothetical protein M3016_04805, partial [Actinomycetota bacterium]|nr:hypothetical protein [Actinomycetota bacterium]
PSPTAGPYAGFASGLKTYSGHPKATFYAYRMPIYMPHTSFSRHRKAEVWGDVRPAPFARMNGFGVQQAQVQYKSAHSGWKTLTTLRLTKPGAYFDIRAKFPGSGLVRVQYTYPKGEGLLSPGLPGLSITSRAVAIRVH